MRWRSSQQDRNNSEWVCHGPPVDVGASGSGSCGLVAKTPDYVCDVMKSLALLVAAADGCVPKSATAARSLDG